MDDTTHLARTLCDVPINTLFAHAVLDGVADGDVWTPQGTDAAHVVHGYGMSLIWGSQVGDAFDAIIERLIVGAYRRGVEWLQIDPRWGHLPWRERLRAVADTSGGSVHERRVLVDERVNFVFDAEVFAARRHHRVIPAGWRIEPADAADHELDWTVAPRDFWRDADQFLAAGGGWRVVREGVTGSLAFVSFRKGDAVELGIETLPALRGQGLGAAVAAHMIAAVSAAGLTPVWACRGGNAASAKTADSVGFVPATRLPYFRLPARRPT